MNIQSLKQVTIFFATFSIGIMTGYYFSFPKNKQPYSHKIALLVPAVHPSMDHISDGFVRTIKELLPEAHVDVYNPNGNKVLMKGQAEEIVAKHYDAACGIGTNASQMLKNTSDKKQVKLPVVFAAVSHPEKIGLIDDKGMVTGVTDHYNRYDQINLLLQIKDIKTPLLLFNPSSNPALENDAAQMKQAFAQHGISLTIMPLYHPNEMYQKISSCITQHDTILTLTDHAICSAMDTLVKLCNRHGVTLITSELDSNNKGAAISYGVSERDYGILSAQKVSDIIINKKHPQDVPVTAIEPFYLKLNRSTLEQQNVHIKPELLDLFEKTRVQKGNHNV